MYRLLIHLERYDIETNEAEDDGNPVEAGTYQTLGQAERAREFLAGEADRYAQAEQVIQTLRAACAETTDLLECNCDPKGCDGSCTYSKVQAALAATKQFQEGETP